MARKAYESVSISYYDIDTCEFVTNECVSKRWFDNADAHYVELKNRQYNAFASVSIFRDKVLMDRYTVGNAHPKFN